MTDTQRMNLVHLMNSSWEHSPYYIEGREFSLTEVIEYINTKAIGEEYSAEGWGEEQHARWCHFLKCLDNMPPEEKTLEMKIVDKSLTTASINLLDNFQFDSTTNQWLPSTDVSLEKGYDILGDMLSLQRGAELVTDESSWIIGNVASVLKEKYADDYDISMVAKATNKSIKTVMMYTSVFEAFQGRRVYGVSFTHHKDMMYTKNLPVEEAIMCLEVGRDNNLSSKDMKALGKVVALERLESGEPVKEVTEDMIHQATLGNIATAERTYFIINAQGKPEYRTGKLPDRVIQSSEYICMLKPRVMDIKGEWHGNTEH